MCRLNAGMAAGHAFYGAELFPPRAPVSRLVLALWSLDNHTLADRETNMIYELRVYSCLPGRLPALLKRFETQTLKIWQKHDIKQAGFWTVLIGDGNNDLYYLLAWQSMAEREQKWTTFQADPAWVAARADSERDGPILSNVKSMFLQPTAFSSVL